MFDSVLVTLALLLFLDLPMAAASVFLASFLNIWILYLDMSFVVKVHFFVFFLTSLLSLVLHLDLFLCNYSRM